MSGMIASSFFGSSAVGGANILEQTKQKILLGMLNNA